MCVGWFFFTGKMWFLFIVWYIKSYHFEVDPYKGKTKTLSHSRVLVDLWLCKINKQKWFKSAQQHHQWLYAALTEEFLQQHCWLTCICEACRSMVMMWSAPATDSMLATSLADIGARLCQKTSRESVQRRRGGTELGHTGGPRLASPMARHNSTETFKRTLNF